MCGGGWVGAWMLIQFDFYLVIPSSLSRGSVLLCMVSLDVASVSWMSFASCNLL